MGTGAVIGMGLIFLAALSAIVYWGFFRKGTREDAKNFVNAKAKKAFKVDSPEMLRENYGIILRDLKKGIVGATADAASANGTFNTLKKNRAAAESERAGLEQSIRNVAAGWDEKATGIPAEECPEIQQLAIRLTKVEGKLEIYNSEWASAERLARVKTADLETLKREYAETEAEQELEIAKAESMQRQLEREGAAESNDAAVQNAKDARARLKARNEKAHAMLEGIAVMKEESSATQERKVQDSIAKYDAAARARQILGKGTPSEG